MNRKPIPGPYKFGDRPPYHLMGYLTNTTTPDEAHLAETYPPLLRSTVQATTPPMPPWTIVKKHNHGYHLPTVDQKTGDCVAAAIAQVLQYLTALQILTRYNEQIYHPAHISYIYGISRVQIGGGRIPGPGSTGAWGAAAVKEYGCLFTDDPGAPRYSAALSNRWGETPGPPNAMQQIAVDNKLLGIRQLNGTDSIRSALSNRELVTIASGRGFRMKPYEEQGFHVFQPSGGWPHQMSFLAWMDKPFQAAYRFNSWGPDAHGTPLQGEPPGGAWNLREDISNEITRYNPEIYAFSLFNADPDDPNHQLVWIPRNLQNVQTPPNFTY